MRNAALSLAVAFFATAGSSAPPSNPPSVRLGSVRITLGESRDSVLAKLKERYSVDNGVVFDTQGQRPVGTVGFRNGRLALGLREWFTEDQEYGYGYASAIYGAFQQLIAEGRTVCTIDIGESREPNFTHRTAFLFCGGKRLEMTNSEYTTPLTGPRRHASLNEIIGDYLRQGPQQ